VNQLLDKLTGGDRRSIGRVGEVVAAVSNDPTLFEDLVQGLLADDPLIRMRAADAVEKISVQHPEYVQPYKEMLINHIAKSTQQEVRWHIAQLFPRLRATQAERSTMVAVLWDYLDDKSVIVQVCAMQALVDFAATDPRIRVAVRKAVEERTRTGSPALRSRGKRLLQKLDT